MAGFKSGEAGQLPRGLPVSKFGHVQLRVLSVPSLHLFLTAVKSYLVFLIPVLNMKMSSILF